MANNMFATMPEIPISGIVSGSGPGFKRAQNITIISAINDMSSGLSFLNVELSFVLFDAPFSPCLYNLEFKTKSIPREKAAKVAR